MTKELNDIDYELDSVLLCKNIQTKEVTYLVKFNGIDRDTIIIGNKTDDNVYIESDLTKSPVAELLLFIYGDRDILPNNIEVTLRIIDEETLKHIDEFNLYVKFVTTKSRHITIHNVSLVKKQSYDTKRETNNSD